VAIVEQGLGGAMGLFPHGHGRDEQGVGLGREVQTAAASIIGIGGDFDKAAALEGLEGSGEGGAIHREQRSDGGHAGRLRAIERHEQRELAVGKAERAESIVEAAREGAGRALDAEAEAAVADAEGSLKRKSRGP
jgi:hypothetical protein